MSVQTESQHAPMPPPPSASSWHESFSVPALQLVTWQTLARHTSPCTQTLPHPPQFALSLVVSLHPLAQQMPGAPPATVHDFPSWPLPQLPQTPARQPSPASQTTAQAPQFS